jgi:hypothetical protein
MVRRVDQSALRVNQAFIIGLLLTAFLADIPLLVVFVAVTMVLGALYPPARLFVLLYQQVLKPLGLLKPDVIEDNPEPHRFALALGGVFTTFSALTLFTGLTAIGWGLAILVVVLAALNLLAGFCAGCFVYYQLNRLGVPGFNRAPLGR